MAASSTRIAAMVFSISSFKGQPRISAPCLITSRLQPAAKCLSLNFFFRDFSSMSCTLLEGRIRATAPIKPESSSIAKSTFSIWCSGSMLAAVRPQPWLAVERIMVSSTPCSRISSWDFTQCSSGYSSKSRSCSRPTMPQYSSWSA